MSDQLKLKGKSMEYKRINKSAKEGSYCKKWLKIFIVEFKVNKEKL